MYDSDEKLDVIGRFSYFEAIADRSLEPYETYFIPKAFERGDTLWYQGESAVTFTFVVEGHFKTVKARCDDREVTVGLFGGGEPIGHAAVFEEVEHSATAEALDDAVVLQIHRSHFLEIFSDEAAVVEAVARHAMRGNRDLVRRLHDLTVSSAEQRLALLFDHLMYSYGIRKPTEGSGVYISVPIPLSRGDLAQLINTRSETVVRSMSKWRERGIVETTEEGFEIYRPEELCELSGTRRTPLGTGRTVK